MKSKRRKRYAARRARKTNPSGSKVGRFVSTAIDGMAVSTTGFVSVGLFSYLPLAFSKSKHATNNTSLVNIGFQMGMAYFLSGVVDHKAWGFHDPMKQVLKVGMWARPVYTIFQALAKRLGADHTVTGSSTANLQVNHHFNASQAQKLNV